MALPSMNHLVLVSVGALFLGLAPRPVHLYSTMHGCPNGRFKKSEYDCSKFYQCSHGEWIEMSCGKGTAFQENKRVCDHRGNVRGCKENVDNQKEVRIWQKLGLCLLKLRPPGNPDFCNRPRENSKTCMEENKNMNSDLQFLKDFKNELLEAYGVLERTCESRGNDQGSKLTEEEKQNRIKEYTTCQSHYNKTTDGLMAYDKMIKSMQCYKRIDESDRFVEVRIKEKLPIINFLAFVLLSQYKPPIGPNPA